MDDRVRQLIAECQRQEESCLYTSTIFFEWLKALRWWRILFVVGPIILGGIASWPLLSEKEDLKLFGAVCALIAGLAPAVYKALDLDVRLETLAQSAHQYKILQDRFRQASRVTALEDFSIFKNEFDSLMDRMDSVRENSLTPPDRFFQKARNKIVNGDYCFAVDSKTTDLSPS